MGSTSRCGVGCRRPRHLISPSIELPAETPLFLVARVALLPAAGTWRSPVVLAGPLERGPGGPGGPGGPPPDFRGPGGPGGPGRTRWSGWPRQTRWSGWPGRTRSQGGPGGPGAPDFRGPRRTWRSPVHPTSEDPAVPGGPDFRGPGGPGGTDFRGPGGPGGPPPGDFARPTTTTGGRRGTPTTTTGAAGSTAHHGGRTAAVGLGRAAAAGLGRTAARGVGIPASRRSTTSASTSSRCGTGLQPVGLLFLRDLDSAPGLTRRRDGRPRRARGGHQSIHLSE